MGIPQSAELFYGLTLDEKQKEYADSIFENKLTITDSKSGTGKTTIAVGCAKIIGKPLYYFFAPVQEKVFGYTPGDEEEKQSKYLIPLYDALNEIGEMPEKAIHSKKDMRPNAWVHATSYAFWRGGNLKDSTIILDECQNWSKHELKKILTRCHDTCTVIMLGHNGQMDISESLSGFQDYIEHSALAPFAKTVTLDHDYRGNLARWADSL